MNDVESAPWRIERPRSLPILIGLVVLQAIGLMGYGTYQVASHGEQIPYIFGDVQQIVPYAVFTGLSSGFVAIILGLINLIVVIALYRLNPWAWVGAMTLQGLSLFAALLAYLAGKPNYVSMVLGVFLVLYLNQRDIQRIYQRVGSLNE